MSQTQNIYHITCDFPETILKSLEDGWKSQLRLTVGTQSEIPCKPGDLLWIYLADFNALYRVERISFQNLQDISDEDLLKEGIDPSSVIVTPREYFINLWNHVGQGRIGHRWEIIPEFSLSNSCLLYLTVC